MARILILMATRTYRAAAFMKAAARLGVGITVGTEREQPLADFTPGATLALDLDRPRRAQQQIVEFAERFPIDAVVGVDDDTTILAALAAEALGLPHNSVESVKATHYKDVMRLILSEADNVLSPWFELVSIDEDPAVVARRVSYPCVVKPLSLSASRGVIRADNPRQLGAAIRELIEILGEATLSPEDPGSRQVLIESFIPGREFALEGLLINGHLIVLALFDKPDPLDGPYFEETIYITPSRLPAQAQQAIAESSASAAAALGLREGPVHVEVRLNEQGPWIVEVAARSVGGLCSNALRFGAADVSLEEIILRQAARLEIASLQRERQPVGVMMIPIPFGGILRDVRGLAEAKTVPGVEDVVISIPRGHAVEPLPRGTQYLGFIFSRGETPQAVESSLREAHRRLKFTIDR
jgi:biotin carboxylase